MAGKTAGVLALQGDFARHIEKLSEHGYSCRAVKRPEALEGVDCLVLPGGESTTLLRLLTPELRTALVTHVQSGLPTLATCAGLILVANDVCSPEQESLKLLDITVERNAYGRQVNSFIAPLSWSSAAHGSESAGHADEIEGVFIRAPRIRRTGATVEVLATYADEPVLVRSGNILGATFHPELSSQSSSFYALLDSLLEERAAQQPASEAMPKLRAANYRL